MLFRKTFGNALATLLGMALALATGAAHAQSYTRVNLDGACTMASPCNTALVASETLLSGTGNTTSQGGQTYYHIRLDLPPLRTTGSLGVGADNTRSLFVRLDLDRMVWAVDLTAAATVRIPDRDGTDLNDGSEDVAGGATRGTNIILESGGRAGGTSAVFALPAGNYTSDALFHSLLHNKLSLLGGTGSGTVTQTTYVDLSQALTGGTSVASTSAPVVTVVPSLRRTAAPGRALVTTVATGFTQLQTAGNNTLGTLTHVVGGGTGGGATTGPTAHWNAGPSLDAAVTTLAHVMRTGTSTVVTLSGDFSIGSFGTAEAANCDGTVAPLTTMMNGQPRESATVAPVLGPMSFCMSVPATNRNQLQAGTYMVATSYQALENAAFPPANLAATAIGSITRDGTRIHIPYLTVDSGYNQRVVIVNRNEDPVQYSFSFTEEDGTTATPGTAARGSVPGESTMVIRASDIVSTTPRNRTAATIDVVATGGTVTVATTQVNLDTGGTDTIVYDNVAGVGL